MSQHSIHGEATGVFDGYDSGPAVKDAIDQRRSHGSGPTVALTSFLWTFLVIKQNFTSSPDLVHTLRKLDA